ncbi:MAG: hypothetical protein EP338_07145 [Bacteroidetes bacterium]|nr:MAG: hypothetical protein EP338_07145 [Bacteroidota bacterium]
MKNVLLLFSFVLLQSVICYGQQPEKLVRTMRAEGKIKIDGKLSEEDWKTVEPATGFTERNPTEGAPAPYRTEVKVLYDNYAIYIGAMCYDDSPDSILRQLGERDDDLNADHFAFMIDTYDKKLDAFGFQVFASGVQKDYRFSDFSYNAVWESKVSIVPEGWIVEMEIPFSAIRFPNSDSMVWNIQFERLIRRTRTQLQWSLVSKNVQNEINYWGRLEGLKDIQNPIRLQFFPYLSANMTESDGSYNYGYGGGADMKFGLSEAFTLDMTLLPDFSQVLSDNIVKNLGAFEVIFPEQRPFFQEGVDLFNRGGLFYSRRIGGRPVGYFDAYDQLDANEIVERNPETTRLMNVSKVSGRTQKGTGIGVLNAVTSETFATVLDTISGRERKVMTNPLVNYNIVAFDQNLKNNSSVYLINLNTSRMKGFADANVTSIGTNLVNKKNSYSAAAQIKLTQKEDTLSFGNLFSENVGNDGVNYLMRVSRIKGEFRWELYSENISPNFDPNDLGVNFRNNFRYHRAQVRYNKYNPFWKLNQLFNTLNFSLEQSYLGNQLLKKQLDYNGFTTLRKSFHSMFVNISSQLEDAIDQFESRIEGQPFMKPGYFYFSGGVSSDYRRKFALDGNIGLGTSITGYGGTYMDGRIAPIIRFSDKFTLRPSVTFEIDDGNVGFAGYDDEGSPFYGSRKVKVLTSLLSAKYLFKNNLSLTMRVRHYWSSGEYYYHGNLDAAGYVIRDNSIAANTDFNFNAFNTDMIFAWQLGPGSFLNVVYKNALVNDQNIIIRSYLNNLSSAFEQNPVNTLTVKFIYFFDVASFKRRLSA